MRRARRLIHEDADDVYLWYFHCIAQEQELDHRYLQPVAILENITSGRLISEPVYRVVLEPLAEHIARERECGPT